MAFLVYVRNSEVSLRSISTKNKILCSIISTGGITVLTFYHNTHGIFFGEKDFSGHCYCIAQVIIS